MSDQEPFDLLFAMYSGCTVSRVLCIFDRLIRCISELQIRGGFEDNSKIFFLFLFVNKNLCCDPILESSWGDHSNEGSQHMF